MMGGGDYAAARIFLKKNMIRKVYRTRSLKGYSISLTIKGEPVHIRFSGGSMADSTATYTTIDPAVQEALESLFAFGGTFYLESEQVIDDGNPEPMPEPEVKVTVEEMPLPVEFKDSQRFRNLVEMKNAMKEAGMEVKASWTYGDARAAAYKEGYDYQIQK